MTTMCDVLEIKDDESFLLHGRTADLVNVAGKRSSFGYLNTQLNAIPGVLDGAFEIVKACRLFDICSDTQGLGSGPVAG